MCVFFFLRIRRPPRSTRTDTLFPYTTLFRSEVAAIAFTNKALVYDLLFKAAADTMLTIAADPRHLGARIGITAVLHTWGSALTHHPHIHMIVPGGGISSAGTRWISARPARSEERGVGKECVRTCRSRG